MGVGPTEGPSRASPPDRTDTKSGPDRHVELAFTARLPTFDAKFFDRQLEAIAREMTIRHGSDREIWYAIKQAKIEVEVGLPDAQHAAVIMERILTNDPPEEQLSALNSVYRHVGSNQK